MEEQVRAECRSVAEFIEKLPPLHFKWEQKIFYRGQSDISYILKPSVLRDTVDVKRSERENEIYLSVMSECSNDFEMEMPHIAILSKMQHYGVPTRLLDITTNALVALYSEKFILICNYLNEHCTEDLTLDEVAKLAGFSKYHFSRLFKQFTNVTFYKYLNQKRISHAEMLLADPTISITEVALRSGFSSLSAFIRMFKLTKKCTPTEFRNLYLTMS